MFSEKNKIPASQQNTPDIEGYYYTANDGSQMAFWIYKEDRVSKEHMHDYDEWTNYKYHTLIKRKIIKNKLHYWLKKNTIMRNFILLIKKFK